MLYFKERFCRNFFEISVTSVGITGYFEQFTKQGHQRSVKERGRR